MIFLLGIQLKILLASNMSLMLLCLERILCTILFPFTLERIISCGLCDLPC